jgi:phage terminase small subunit
MKKMTPLQAGFVLSYLRDPHPGRAAKAAGYDAGSVRAFGVIGRRLLRDPRVKAAIDEGRLPEDVVAAPPPVEVAKPNQLPALDTLTVYGRQQVLARLTQIADVSVLDLFKTVRRGGKERMVPKDLHEIDPRVAYAIEKITITEGGKLTIAMVSKLAALRLLGQANGLKADDDDDEPVGAPMTEGAKPTLEERLRGHPNVVALGAPKQPA